MSERGITVWIWCNVDGFAKPCDPPTVTPRYQTRREPLLKPGGERVGWRLYHVQQYYFPREVLPSGVGKRETVAWCAERACEKWLEGGWGP